MSTSKYNKQNPYAKSETGLVAASTSEILTKGAFARQGSEPNKVNAGWNPPKARIGRGRPFTPSQQWTLSGGIAECIVAPGFIACVDVADLEIVDGHRWYILTRGENHYAATGQGFLMHRMIVGAGKGDPRRVDHHDCNGLNCCRYNLRITGQQNNTANRRHHRPTKNNPYKGVFRRAGQVKFSAQITKTIDGKKVRFHLGQFENPEEGARAYDRKARELFGEFARASLPLPTADRRAA